MARAHWNLSPRAVRLARLALTPWRFAWALANRRGWLGKAPVGTAPHLDEEALVRWTEEVSRACVYLEYGSGGSTVQASLTTQETVSVDSDGDFLAAVERKLAEDGGDRGKVTTIHVDIGLTEKWGRPVFGLPTQRNLRKWRRYTAAPWEYLESAGLVPDFVFVDGRFRVACVLETLLRLPPDAITPIMLDDYARSTTSYQAVLEFAEGERAGRALLLRRKAPFDRDQCARELARYQADPE